MWQKTKNIYHLAVAVLVNTYFSFPGRKLTVIGITGTDGKTTTTSLIYHILKTAGKHTSLISTVAAYIGNDTFDTGFHVTNPSAIPLQRFLKKITSLGREKEENYLVLEVTSHGIDQNRIWGIPFAIAGITNITHEHLDYHKTYESYVATKTRLLQKANIAVINKDDASFESVREKLQVNNRKLPKKVITYGLEESADVNAKTMPFKTKLLGVYNIYNCLLAIAICRELKISQEDIQRGIETFMPPLGRGEVVYEKEFTVMVDFAHTPNAFLQLLATLRPNTKGRLIHVFGSAGLRDNSKRPLMGKAAGMYDDIIILTAEDPRSEKVEDINKQIRSGISLKSHSEIIKGGGDQGKIIVIEIPDRQEAINKAISMAKKGDMVVVTGKAHEKSMNLGRGEEAWDEFSAVQEALRLRSGS